MGSLDSARSPRLPTFEETGGREEAPATGMCRWEGLPGWELLALHRGLERVVVAVGATAFLERHPPQDRLLGNRVVHTARPCGREHLAERALERLVLPFAIAGTDSLDETTGVTFLAGVDRDGEALAQRHDDCCGGVAREIVADTLGARARGRPAGAVGPVERIAQHLRPAIARVVAVAQHLLRARAALVPPNRIEQRVLIVLGAA